MKTILCLVLFLSFNLQAGPKKVKGPMPYQDRIGLTKKMDKFLLARFNCLVSVGDKPGFSLVCDGTKMPGEMKLPEKTLEQKMTVAMFYFLFRSNQGFKLVSCNNDYTKCLFRRG